MVKKASWNHGTYYSSMLSDREVERLIGILKRVKHTAKSNRRLVKYYKNITVPKMIALIDRLEESDPFLHPPPFVVAWIC